MSRRLEVEMTLERDGVELDVTVCGTVEPVRHARLSGHPDTWCPSEGGEVEVDGVMIDGKPWPGELTDEEREVAEERLSEAAFEVDDGPDCDRDYDDGWFDA